MLGGLTLSAGVVLILFSLHSRARRYPALLNGHWAKRIKEIQMSPIEFYKLLDGAIDKRRTPRASGSTRPRRSLQLAQSAHSNDACSRTVCVAFSCLSGG